MTDDADEVLIRTLQIIADHLDAWTDGDEHALETLGAAFEQASIDADDIQAIACVLRGLCAGAAEPDPDDAGPEPATHSHRVLSSEERAILMPEAWGYLLWLRRQGSLDATQCERVLDLVAESGVRPVSIEQVREVAVRIAMSSRGEHDPATQGSLDLSH